MLKHPVAGQYSQSVKKQGLTFVEHFLHCRIKHETKDYFRRDQTRQPNSLVQKYCPIYSSNSRV